MAMLGTAMRLPDPLHPALVHFPIVLILIGAVLALAALALRNVWLVRSVAVVMALAAAGSLAAAWSGEEDEDAAERAGAAAEQVLEEHEEWGERTRNAAILTAIAAAAAALLFKRNPALARGSAGLTAALAVAACWCVIEAGHYGGLLVYQHGVGVNASQSTKPVQQSARHHDDD